MRTGVSLNPTDPTSSMTATAPKMHVWRARIVLATADGLGTAAIMRAAGVSKTAVWR